MPSPIDDLAAATLQHTGQVASLAARFMVVTAVNTVPTASLDLSLIPGGPTVIQDARYSSSYKLNTPAVGDVVYVLVTQSGGSSRVRGRVRGGNVFVVDRVAT